MKFNPNAVAFLGFCAGVGYLIGDLHGAIVGLTVGLGMSVLISLLP
jgi:hypothetical protein